MGGENRIENRERGWIDSFPLFVYLFNLSEKTDRKIKPIRREGHTDKQRKCPFIIIRYKINIYRH